MSPYRGPFVLTGEHVTTGFDGGKASLDTWLQRRARGNQRSATSRTWVVCSDGPEVVALCASAVASILRGAATGRAARNHPDEIPAILLARLAVDRKHQGHGLGQALLKHFVEKALEASEIVGVRLLLVHALDDQRNSHL
ncbi:MAG: GNAT family N-acetyltransferase [Actinomycetota bacterium]|nr:GNAT family N-acetyltransferase [Actinomycetota bacterium]